MVVATVKSKGRPVTRRTPCTTDFSPPFLLVVRVYLHTIKPLLKSSRLFYCTRTSGTLTKFVEHKVEDEMLYTEQWGGLLQGSIVPETCLYTYCPHSHCPVFHSHNVSFSIPRL
jgi:hypothetical protein